MAQPLPLDGISTEDFFNRVVPGGGHYVIAWKEDDHIFHHKVFTLVTDAVNTAKQLTFQRKEVYFALASYKQGFHKAPDDKMVLRVQSNVRSLRALWVDIDVGKQGYQDQREAIQGLRTFCTKTLIPLPTLLVSSGTGLHAYWTFDRAIPPHEWQGMATALREASLQNGLQIDPGITVDSARILRLPGTFNYKRPKNPTPVELLYALAGDYDPDAIRSALLAWADPLPPRAVTPEIQESLQEISEGLALNSEPSYVKHIVQRCKVMEHVHTTAGASCQEPLWVATLQLIKHCADGDDWVHPLSEGHPGYDEDDTNRKYAQRLQNTLGPTLCSTFEQHLPDKCKVCPHHGKIKTPFSIGKDKFEDPRGMPFPWRPGTGAVPCIERWTRDGDGEGEWNMSFPFVIEKVSAAAHAAGNAGGDTGYEFDITVRNLNRSARISLPSTLLGDLFGLKQVMGTHGFTINNKGKAEELADFMTSWLNKLSAAKAVRVAPDSLGWQSDGSFSLGHARVLTDGTVEEGVKGRADAGNLSHRYHQQGELENWRRAANHVTTQGHPELAVIIASAFAAPLMRFTGDSGFLLSVVSHRSGVGKSTAMAIAQAVWGDPNGVNSINDTENAVSEKLGFLSSLPAYWDEIKGKRAMETMAHMAFRISEGRTKARLSSTGKMQPVKTWNTILLAASNASLIEFIQHADLHTDAGLLRVFEVRVDIDHTGQPAPTPSDTYQNFGWAGEVFAKFLVKNAKQIERIVLQEKLRYTAELHAKGAERFWIDAITVLMVGARMAVRIGLVDFDLQALEDHLKKSLQWLRVMHTGATLDVSPTTVLAKYLSETFAERLVTDILPGKATGNAAPRVTYLPQRNSPEWQMAKDTKELIVPAARFRDWLRKNGYALQAASDMEKLAYVSYGDYTIGGRTPYAVPRCKGWLIDASMDPTLAALFDY